MNGRTPYQVEPSELYEAGSPSLFSSLAALPSVVLRALRAGRASIAVQLSIARGERNVPKLTNMVFFARHPERQGANSNGLTPAWEPTRPGSPRRSRAPATSPAVAEPDEPIEVRSLYR